MLNTPSDCIFNTSDKRATGEGTDLSNEVEPTFILAESPETDISEDRSVEASEPGSDVLSADFSWADKLSLAPLLNTVGGADMHSSS